MAGLVTFRDDIQKLLKVFNEMEHEATVRRYDGPDLIGLQSMRHSFTDALPRVEEALAHNDPAIAAGAFYMTLNYFHAFFVDGTFGDWSEVWRKQGKEIMVDAAKISDEQAEVLESSL